jgi:hypothetical protein
MDGSTWRQWLESQLICNGWMALAMSQQWLYGKGISLTAIDGLIHVLRWLYGNGNKLE